MRIKKVCKLCIDIGMLVITVLLMASERTGIVLHMFFGAVLWICRRGRGCAASDYTDICSWL